MVYESLTNRRNSISLQEAKEEYKSKKEQQNRSKMIDIEEQEDQKGRGKYRIDRWRQ